MPIEILEFVVRARIQQSGADNQQNGESNNARNNPAATGTAGQQSEQLSPTPEEIINDILKRSKER
jgi:hypothetical protein